MRISAGGGGGGLQLILLHRRSGYGSEEAQSGIVRSLLRLTVESDSPDGVLVALVVVSPDCNTGRQRQNL